MTATDFNRETTNAAAPDTPFIFTVARQVKRRALSWKVACFVLVIVGIAGYWSDGFGLMPLGAIQGFVRSKRPERVSVAVEGEAREIRVGPGDYVNAGDILVVLQNSEIEHEIALLHEEAKSVEESLIVIAESRVRRRSSESRDVTVGDLIADQAREHVRLLGRRASIARQLAFAERRQKQLTIVAARSGYITEIGVAIGQTVTRGTLVAQLFDPSESVVELEIEADDVARIDRISEFEVSFSTHPGFKAAYEKGRWRPVSPQFIDEGGSPFRRQTRHILILRPRDPKLLPSHPKFGIADGTVVDARPVKNSSN